MFWALDKGLADKKHFPAINWTKSYTKYAALLEREYFPTIHVDFKEYRNKFKEILTKEQGLQETVQLVGKDALT